MESAIEITRNSHERLANKKRNKYSYSCVGFFSAALTASSSVSVYKGGRFMGSKSANEKC